MDGHPTPTRELAPKLPAASYHPPDGGSAGSPEIDMSSSSQQPVQHTFRRQRKGRACSACHTRRIRCDAASLGIPCTNCVAFSQRCFIPPRRKKKRPGYPPEEPQNTHEALIQNDTSSPHAPEHIVQTRSPQSQSTKDTTPSSELTDPLSNPPEAINLYAHLVQPNVSKAPIKEPGRVAYVAEHSNMSWVIQQQGGSSDGDITHYPLPESRTDTSEGPTRLDKLELDILRMQGALSLPPKSLCDELIEAFFIWVAPLVPVVNKTRFMQQYQDPDHPTSLLLLNTICLAGSRVCTKVQLLDDSGSPMSAATIFYRRAKALYDSGYEEDRLTTVQALILMGWYWEEPGKVTRNVCYWVGLAVALAQGFGMHRNARRSRLSLADKRLWKRIWWTLFTRDRSVAVAMGRPVQINIDESDVEMLSEDDFIEDDNNLVAVSPPDALHVQFFLQYVKICQIMDLILVQHYSIKSKARRHHALALTQCDSALAAWLRNCPETIRWDHTRYQFWPALLHCFYHTTCCLLHRAHLTPPPHPPTEDEDHRDRPIFPRINPAFHSACEVTAVIESMIIETEICYSPPFMVYALMSALLVLIYEMHTAVGEAYVALQKRTWVCMHALKKISNIWLVAKMAHKLFESIIITAGFEDCIREVENGGNEEHQDGDSVKAEDASTIEGSENAIGNSPKPDKPSEPALTVALMASMEAALKSLTLSTDPKTQHAVKYNNVTLGPRPLPSHKPRDMEGNQKKSPGFSQYDHFMATLQPYELFTKDIPSNIRMLQAQSESSESFSDSTGQTSPWSSSAGDQPFQAPQIPESYSSRRTSSTTTVFGWQIEK